MRDLCIQYVYLYCVDNFKQGYMLLRIITYIFIKQSSHANLGCQPFAINPFMIAFSSNSVFTRVSVTAEEKLFPSEKQELTCMLFGFTLIMILY